MINKLVRTEESWALTIVRLGLGVVFFAHGAQKMLGWFGGGGFLATVHGFGVRFHLPAAVVVLVILAEFLGSIGLIVGCLTRIAAFAIAVDMLGAIFIVTLPNGFFMNWGGKQRGEGIEFQILVISMCIALILKGAGSISVDGTLSRIFAPVGGGQRK